MALVAVDLPGILAPWAFAQEDHLLESRITFYIVSMGFPRNDYFSLVRLRRWSQESLDIKLRKERKPVRCGMFLASGRWKIISLGTCRDDRGSDQSCPIRLAMNQFLSSIARGAPMQELLAFSLSVQCSRRKTELAPWWASVVKPSAHTYQ